MTNQTKCSFSKHPSKPDTATLRRWAVASSSDPRTVEKVLRGEPVRGLAGYRVRAVLAAEGIKIAGKGV